MRKFYYLVTTLVLSCHLVMAQVSDPSSSYGLPFMTNYTSDDYEVEGRTWGFVQDSSGVMIVAHTSGILTFDGVSWRSTKMSNERQVKSIDMDAKGTVFVGGNDDLGYLALDSTGKLKHHSLLHLIPEEYREFKDVWHTISTRDGVFFHTNYHVFHYTGDTIQTYPNQGQVFHEAWKIRGEFYVRDHRYGLVKYENGGLELVPGGEELAQLIVRTILPFGEDDFWLVDSAGKVYSFADGNLSTDHPFIQSVQQGLGTGLVSSETLLPDRGFLLNVSGEGTFIFREDGTLKYHLTKQKGLALNAFESCFIDQHQNLWLGGNGGISHVMINHSMTFAGEKLGIDRALKSAVINNNTLYLGTAVGVLKEAQGQYTWLYDTGLETWGMEVVNDELYVVFDSYVAEITPEEKRRYVTSTTLPHWGMIQLRNKPDHYLAGLYHRGLIGYHNNGQKLVQTGRIAGYNGNAENIVEDETGKLWISDGNSDIDVITLNDELDSAVQVRTYGMEDGLVRERGNRILPFQESGVPKTLIASGDRFLTYQAETDSLTPYAPLNGLVSGNKGLPFLQTSAGVIYTLAGGKPVIFHPNGNGYTVDSVSLNNITKLKIRNFEELPDGSLLVLTNKGLVHQSTTPFEPFQQDFQVKVRSVNTPNMTLFGGYQRSEAYVQQGKVQYADNNIKFAYAAAFFDEPTRTQYQYKLEGFDQEWSDWSFDASKEYTNLREGNYTFRVRAKNQYDKLSPEDTFSFAVAPPWYRSPLSYFAYVILFAMVIWIIVRLNTQKLQKQKARLEQVVAERTEEVKAQAMELIHKNQNLEELSTFKQGLTDMIAHDMKNPLNVVIGLSEGQPDANKMKQVNQSGKLMLQMVTNMLDVQKFDETEMKLNLAPHTLMDMLVQAKFQVELLAMARSIQFDFEVSKDIQLSCDREVVLRILVNLFTNGIKYSNPGSKIKIGAVIEQNRVQISVADKGKGIHADDLPYVFDKFWQSSAKKSGQIQSTGLGLTFCKIAVEAHGGSITVHSSEGQGSTFQFDLAASDSKPQTSDQPIGLASSEFEAIQEIIAEIRQIPLYQFADIEHTLQRITLESESVLAWKNALSHAALNWDEAAFEKLLTHPELSKT